MCAYRGLPVVRASERAGSLSSFWCLHRSVVYVNLCVNISDGVIIPLFFKCRVLITAACLLFLFQEDS